MTRPVSRAKAIAASKHFAHLRTTLRLLNLSDRPKSDIYAIRDDIRDSLDYHNLIYPQSLLDLGITPESTLDERRSILDIPPSVLNTSHEEKKFLDFMQNKGNNARKGEWSWRIGQEAEEKHALGWHPFFVTLTVDPKQADPKEIWTETNEFRKYIRSLVNVVCDELGHPPAHKRIVRKGKVIWDYRPESEYVTYAGVIEHGKSREHHHGHFVIWMRAIPSSWRICPNYGIANPANRTKNECRELSTIWPWSGYDPATGGYLSPALYFRSVGDVWSKRYNFALPLKNGKPMNISTPRAAGNYITKYLQKEHKEWHHRMKATRSLGMMTLAQYINRLDLQTAEALTWRAKDANLNHSLSMIHSVPLGLIRSLAKRQVFYLKFKLNLLDLTELIDTSLPSFTKMLRSVRTGARPDKMDSAQFYDWLNQFLPEQTGYCEVTQESAHAGLAWLFPRVDRRVRHVLIGGLEIGYS